MIRASEVLPQTLCMAGANPEVLGNESEHPKAEPSNSVSQALEAELGILQAIYPMSQTSRGMSVL